MGCLLLGRRLFAGVLVSADPIVEVVGANGLGVDGVASPALSGEEGVFVGVGLFELVDSLFVDFLDGVEGVERVVFFGFPEFCDQDLVVFLIDDLLVGKFGQVGDSCSSFVALLKHWQTFHHDFAGPQVVLWVHDGI